MCLADSDEHVRPGRFRQQTSAVPPSTSERVRRWIRRSQPLRSACLIEKEAFVLLECQGKSQSFGSSPGGGWIETCLVFKDRI